LKATLSSKTPNKETRFDSFRFNLERSMNSTEFGIAIMFNPDEKMLGHAQKPLTIRFLLVPSEILKDSIRLKLEPASNMIISTVLGEEKQSCPPISFIS
jgi:hypothetical protein